MGAVRRPSPERMVHMKQIDMKAAIKRYNEIMECIGYDHRTIGKRLSEDTEGWNIRDMVAECDYTLSTYYESGHCNEEMRHSYEEDERKMWRSETGKLKRFIKAYEPFIEGVVCKDGHCSKYDNYDSAYWAARELGI